MQGQFLNIINNLQQYFEGPLAQAFWANQFHDDVHGVMTSPQPGNAAWALALVGEAWMHYGFPRFFCQVFYILAKIWTSRTP